jgi:hypothetical protein
MVLDPYHFNAVPDQVFRLNADLDPHFNADTDLLLIKVMRICDQWASILSLHTFILSVHGSILSIDSS